MFRPKSMYFMIFWCKNQKKKLIACFKFYFSESTLQGQLDKRKTCLYNKSLKSHQNICQMNIKFDIKFADLLFLVDRISPQFNRRMREWIATSMDMLRRNCFQTSDFISRPLNLSKIISLYLIQFHGYARYVTPLSSMISL